MKSIRATSLGFISMLVLLGCTGCLPDNFWSDKWGEVVNRGIFGAINLALGAATNNAVQI